MSKVFLFSHLYSLITLLISASLLLGAAPVFADQNDFTIEQNPNPISVSDKNITITIRKKDNSDYFVGTKYSFVAWKGSQLDQLNSCNIVNFVGKIAAKGKLTQTSTAIDVTWDITTQDTGQCVGVRPGDTWHFRLWAGDGWGDINNTNNIIINDYPFAFTQTGGTLISLSAKNPDVYGNQQPIVIMSNADPQGKYSFWWKGDSGIGTLGIVAHYPNDKSPDNPQEIIIPSFERNQANRILCMEYGWFDLPPGENDCNPSVTFNFKTGQPPPPPSGPPKCTIPANIPLNSEAILKIENVSNGTKVAAYAIDQTKTSSEPTASGTADSTNSVTLNLLKKASTTTTYTVIAYKESDPSQNICTPNQTFSVGGVNAAPKAEDKCKTKDSPECSKAGGDPCGTDTNNPDPRGPGFKTAIGCIHTTPKVLVQDFLTFGVGIGGGLAFMMMLFGAFQMLTSGGNPQNLQGGRDVFQNAIIGLLFIIFSILLMKIIGIDILNLPGFS